MSSFFTSLCSRVKTNPYETELWCMIYWLDPCDRLSGGCLLDATVFLAITGANVELHSKTKNRGASRENGKCSLTHKPQRRSIQEPRYKSVETGE